MSEMLRNKHRLETFASISDSEAEFWTTSNGLKKNEYNPKSINPSLNILSSDGLYFKSNNQLDEATKDQLALLFKENLAKQVDDVNKEAEKKPISDIFQFDNDTIQNENIPGVNMSFLDRLIHQLIRPRAASSDLDDSIDEDFTEIDANEITSVINDSFELSSKREYQSNENHDLSKSTIRQFIEDIHEEIDVILGILRPDELAQQRSERAKFPSQSKEKFNEQSSVNSAFF